VDVLQAGVLGGLERRLADERRGVFAAEALLAEAPE
jgi:hypothetical protein